MRPNCNLMILALTATALAACGGGGSADIESGNPPPPTNSTTAPTDPAPAPAPDPAPGDSAASGCFNPAFFVTGTRIDTVRRLSFSVAAVATITSSKTVDGLGTFDGKAAIKITDSEVYEPHNEYAGPRTSGTVTRFFAPDSNGSSYREYGSDARSMGSPSFTVITTHSPFSEVRLNLALQDTHTRTHTSTTSYGDGVTYTRRLAYVESVQYNGLATVTVPAGTFQACQYTVTSTETDGDTGAGTYALGTTWIGVGNGLLLKDITDVGPFGMPSTRSTHELVSASINGVPVKP